MGNFKEMGEILEKRGCIWENQGEKEIKSDI